MTQDEVRRAIAERVPEGEWFVVGDLGVPGDLTKPLGGMVVRGEVIRRPIKRDDPRRSNSAKFEYRLPS